jgi:hypothetical protein
MDAQQISRRSPFPPRAKLVVTIAAAVALLTGVVAAVNLPAHAGRVPSVATSSPAGIDPPTPVDSSVPSAQAVFDLKTKVLPDEQPLTF